MSKQSILTAKSTADNEYYTRSSLANYIVSIADNYISKLPSNSNIWLPCDSNSSQITIAAKEKWPQHNIINTSDNLYNHPLDNIDYIITNPPFHGIFKIIRHFESKSIPYLLLIPYSSIGIMERRGFNHYYTAITNQDMKKFVRPDGTLKVIGIATVSNIPECRELYGRSDSNISNLKQISYYEPIVNKTIRRTIEWDVKVGETAAIPASSLMFIDYNEWEFFGMVSPPGCYLSAIAKRLY